MPNALGPTGLTTATQTELVTALTTSLQSIYGSDINLDPDSPDAQWLMNIIQQILDQEDLLTQIYTSWDLMQAVGTQLDNRCALIGIQRLGGTYSTVQMTIVTNQSVTIYGLDQGTNPVFTVADSSGNQWQLITTTNLNNGTNTDVLFQAANSGAITVQASQIQTAVTVVLGVTSVNNPSIQATTGVTQETDAAFRLRAMQSVALSSQGYLAGLRAALLNISGLTSVYLYENVTGTTDGNGVPGHSIWVIVAGTPVSPSVNAWSSTTTYSIGNLASSGGTTYVSIQNNNTNNAVTNTSYWAVYNPIPYTIYKKRSAGCGMYGSQSYTVTQVDGTPFIVYWDNVENETLFIQFTATSINGTQSPQLALIATDVPNNFIPTVNQELNINQIATQVQVVDPNTLVTNCVLFNGQSQTLTLSGTPASGNFVLNYGGNATGSIAWNASTATIQSDLQALAGLSSATVTGSLSSGSLVISIPAPTALVYVTYNTLETSVPAAITFSYSYVTANKLSPQAKNYQFSISSENIIMTSMTISPTSVSLAPGANQQFTVAGGYGTYTYTIPTNNSGGSITSAGKYTAGSTAGTDTVQATDVLGNYIQATVTVT